MSSVSSMSAWPAARRRARSNFNPLPRPLPSSRTTALSAGNRANSWAHVTPSRAWTIRPESQQRLSGSTTIRTGFGPKNFIGGGLFDLGPVLLVEHLEQGAGPHAGLQGRPSQGRNARGGCRPLHDPQQPPGDAQADPLGLGDGGKLVLLVGGELHGVLEPLLKGLIFRLLLGELPLKFVDAGLCGGPVQGVHDRIGLAVEGLPRLLTILSHLGNIAVVTEENGESTGDALRDRGHGNALRRGQFREDAHDCTRSDGNCPPSTPGEWRL